MTPKSSCACSRQAATAASTSGPLAPAANQIAPARGRSPMSCEHLRERAQGRRVALGLDVRREEVAAPATAAPASRAARASRTTSDAGVCSPLMPPPPPRPGRGRTWPAPTATRCATSPASTRPMSSTATPHRRHEQRDGEAEHRDDDAPGTIVRTVSALTEGVQARERQRDDRDGDGEGERDRPRPGIRVALHDVDGGRRAPPRPPRRTRRRQVPVAEEPDRARVLDDRSRGRARSRSTRARRR